MRDDEALLPVWLKTLALKTVGDLMDHLGKDLALRFVASNAAGGSKEAVRRELSELLRTI